MSAAEINQQLESRPLEDQGKAFAHLQAHETGAFEPGHKPAGVPNEGFKKLVGAVSAKHDELFRKLAP